jgi:hypothetical protein
MSKQYTSISQIWIFGLIMNHLATLLSNAKPKISVAGGVFEKKWPKM